MRTTTIGETHENLASRQRHDGDQSISRALTAQTVTALRQLHPSAQVSYRDLAADPLPHLTLDVFAQPIAQDVMDEFLASDVVVIGAPMYNFSVPTQLKSWLDLVLRAGHTFKYTPEGPVRLAGRKQVIIVSTRGSLYEQNFQEDYLKFVFQFMGITDIDVVQAQGVGYSPEHKERAIELARQTIDVVVNPSLALAA